MFTLKAPHEIAAMKTAGEAVDRAISKGFDFIEQSLKSNLIITKIDVARIMDQVLLDLNIAPAFRGFKDYEYTCCISINDELVHGIPNDTQIKNGDVVTLDLGTIYRGWYGDGATTRIVGTYDKNDEKYIKIQSMMDSCYTALLAGIAKCRPGGTLEDVTRALYEVLSQSGFGIIEQYTGHGIGREMHEEPPIWNTLPIPASYANIRLRKGMVFCLEPMLALTLDPQTLVLEDKWTVAMADGSICTHCERMVAIVDSGPFLLTNTGA